MSKFVNKSMSINLKRWAFLAIPARRLQYGYKEIKQSSGPYNFQFISKIGAI